MQLAFKEHTVWEKASKGKRKKIVGFCEEYKKLLDRGKTERECTLEIVRLAKQHGFKKEVQIEPGARIYRINRRKNIALLVIGKEPIENGLNIIVSHIDAPRIDLKQRPLYEDKETKIALFKTHYYGGIKKYQWANIPLSLYGKIIRRDGTELDFKLGEKEGVSFLIPDLLPHLAGEQLKRKLEEGLKGEELNILVGSIPWGVNNEKEEKEKVKYNVLKLLHQKYGLVEEDFISAEIEAVPSYRANDVGFDCSMVAAYGQDDRACAYASLKAILELYKPPRSCLALFMDKEEIGSEGSTGMKSRFLENVLAEFTDKPTMALARSKALSGDVNGAMDPTFKDVYEKRNAAKLGHGVVLTKYTGKRGKTLASDASAEYMGEIRRMFNRNKIDWQCAELGKVDEGGGGTVAKYLAKYNMDVVDCGPPVLSMHSPYEITSKADIYAAYEAYRAFFMEEERDKELVRRQ